MSFKFFMIQGITGSASNVAVFDGTSWVDIYRGVIPNGQVFTSIHGTSISEFAIGLKNNGVATLPTVSHYEGGVFIERTIPVMVGPDAASVVTGIQYFSPTDIYAVSYGTWPISSLSHWDGVAWTELAVSPFGEYFYGVSAFDATEVYISGIGGAGYSRGLWHWNGAVLVPDLTLPVVTGPNLGHISGMRVVSPAEVYVYAPYSGADALGHIYVGSFGAWLEINTIAPGINLPSGSLRNDMGCNPVDSTVSIVTKDAAGPPANNYITTNVGGWSTTDITALTGVVEATGSSVIDADKILVPSLQPITPSQRAYYNGAAWALEAPLTYDLGSDGVFSTYATLPYVTLKSPDDLQIGVNKSTFVSFTELDADLDADSSKTIIYINGAKAWENDLPTTGFTGYFAPVTGGFVYSVKPSVPFAYGSTVVIDIYLEDSLGNNSNTQYRFYIEDAPTYSEDGYQGATKLLTEIDFPLQFGNSGDVALCDLDKSIDNNIRACVFVSIKSIPFKPVLGSYVSKTLFEPTDDLSKGLIRESILESIKVGEKRVVPNSNITIEEDSSGNLLNVSVPYKNVSNNDGWKSAQIIGKKLGI